MEVRSWLSLQNDSSKSRRGAEVMLSVVSLISSSTGILGCLWTLYHRVTCKWYWTEAPTVSFPLRVDSMNSASYMNTERCRREEGHNLYQLECRMSARKLVRQKPQNYCQLETQVVPLHKIFFSSCPNTKYLYLRLPLLKMKAFRIILVSLVFFFNF